MGCTLCLNKSEMASFFNSFEENKSDFKYINECKFYGYPKYRNLKIWLAQILNENHRFWPTYYSELLDQKRLMSQYLCFVQAANQFLAELLQKETTVQDIVTQFQIKLSEEFNLKIMHQLVIEVQDITLSNTIHCNLKFKYFVKISFNFCESVYQSEQKLIDGETYYDWVVTEELKDCYIEEIFLTNGDLKIPEGYLNDKLVKLELFYQKGSHLRRVGDPVTFSLLEVQDQQIYEKSVKIVRHSRLVAKLKIRQ